MYCLKSSSANAIAIERVIAEIAPLEAEYATRFGAPCAAMMEDMFTMDPPLPARTIRSATPG